MYKNLYDCFKHWYRGGSIWVYSDPHFDDDELDAIVENRPTSEEQVKRINSKLGKNDTIIFLGDIGNVKWIKKIRGYKVLIMGNHDKGANHYKRVVLKTHESECNPEVMTKLTNCVYKDGYYVYDNHLFDEVYEGCLMISPKIILSHEPVNFPYAFNIHGHDHSSWYNKDEFHFNVCADHINYTPVNLPALIKDGYLKDIPDIHRVTIDNAIRRNFKRGK